MPKLYQCTLLEVVFTRNFYTKSYLGNVRPAKHLNVARELHLKLSK